MAYGQDGHLGISYQQSYGTQFVSSMDFIPFVTEGLTEGIEDLRSEALSTRIGQPDPYEGMHSVEGDIVTEVHPHNIGKFLFGWFGQESVSYQGSCYSHLFLPNADDWDAEKSFRPPATIEVYRDTGSAYGYYDCCINVLSFEIAQGALIRATAGIVGAKFDWTAKQTASYETGSYFTWDTCSVSLAGSAVDDISALTITLTNNISGKAYLDGQKTFGRILRDDYVMVEVAGTMLLNSDTEARNYRNRTKQRLLITATDPTTIMNGHNQLIIDVPQMKYTEFPANLTGPGLVEVSFAAVGEWDVTSSYHIKTTLVNTYAAYV
jgi:hypothetical protein